MVSTLEQMQVPNGTGPGVRRSKHPLLASCTRCNVLWKPQGLGSEEEEEVSLRIEKVIKKVHINRKSHSYFARALLLGIQSAGKIGVGFTMDMDFF